MEKWKLQDAYLYEFEMGSYGMAPKKDEFNFVDIGVDTYYSTQGIDVDVRFIYLFGKHNVESIFKENIAYANEASGNAK